MPGFGNMLNVHPLFVHFPIALTLTALLFEVLFLVGRKSRFHQTSTALIYLSALAAVITVLTGYRAANVLGHDAPGHDFVHVHRDIMLWFTGILVFMAAVHASLSRGGRVPFPIWQKLGRPVLLLAATAILMIGTDRGGELVFRYGMGVNTEAPAMEVHDHSGHSHDQQLDQEVKTEKETGNVHQPDHDDDHDHDHQHL